jgi:hypothetical protein
MSHFVTEYDRQIDKAFWLRRAAVRAAGTGKPYQHYNRWYDLDAAYARRLRVARERAQMHAEGVK